MTHLIAFLLGIVQGLTEFLPVSSSGHLVVIQSFFPGFHGDELAFDVVLHLGTLLAVIVYFRKDLLALTGAVKPGVEGGRERRLLLWIVLATIPTGLIGFLGRDVFRQLFSVPRLVGITLLITALLLWLAERIPAGKRTQHEAGWWRSVVIGLAQGLAILPGISRSGATIAAGMFSGLDRVQAARFSFLISIPAILGATLLDLPAITRLSGQATGPLLTGFLTSLLTGYAALGLLMFVVRRGRLVYFSLYCVIVGVAVLLFL
jgi:undecaprenyl-diphosphatase